MSKYYICPLSGLVKDGKFRTVTDLAADIATSLHLERKIEIKPCIDPLFLGEEDNVKFSKILDFVESKGIPSDNFLLTSRQNNKYFVLKVQKGFITQNTIKNNTTKDGTFVYFMDSLLVDNLDKCILSKLL